MRKRERNVLDGPGFGRNVLEFASSDKRVVLRRKLAPVSEAEASKVIVYGVAFNTLVEEIKNGRELGSKERMDLNRAFLDLHPGVRQGLIVKGQSPGFLRFSSLVGDSVGEPWPDDREGTIIDP